MNDNERDLVCFFGPDVLSPAEFLSRHMLPVCFDHQDNFEFHEIILYNRKGSHDEPA